MKTAEREQARALRAAEGLPIKEIARRLGVSKSSVSCWVRDIELTPEQEDALRTMNPAYNRQLSGWREAAARHREERTRFQEERAQARSRRRPILHCRLHVVLG
jgi:transcriptional regulator with XRE-family HTH domain